MNERITPDDLAAARALYADRLAPCPFCGGHMARHGNQLQSYAAPVLLLENPAPGMMLQVWKVKCWSCSAQVIGQTAEAAVGFWNRRTP